MITARFIFRSHTIDVPLCDVVARMCCTFRFHATHAMSPGGALVRVSPGEKTDGAFGFERSVMKTSLFDAPDARRLVTAGLNSSPRTGPVCWSTVATTGSAPWPPMITPGL